MLKFAKKKNRLKISRQLHLMDQRRLRLVRFIDRSRFRVCDDLIM